MEPEQKTEPVKTIYTVAEVAVQIGMSERHVYDAIAARELPAMRMGKRKGLRIHADDLKAWMDSKRSAAVVEPPPLPNRLYRQSRKPLKYF